MGSLGLQLSLADLSLHSSSVVLGGQVCRVCQGPVHLPSGRPQGRGPALRADTCGPRHRWAWLWLPRPTGCWEMQAGLSGHGDGGASAGREGRRSLAAPAPHPPRHEETAAVRASPRAQSATDSLQQLCV